MSFLLCSSGTKMGGGKGENCESAVDTKKGNMAQTVGGVREKHKKHKDCLWDGKTLNFSFKMCFISVVEILALI